MAPKQRLPRLSNEQAHAALRWLTATRKVTAKQIRDALRAREQLAAEIRTRLEQLGDEGFGLLRGRESLLRRVPAKPKRRRPTAKAQAAWRAQGHYMAAVRRLPKAKRVKEKAVREKRGAAAAIAAAKKMAKQAAAGANSQRRPVRGTQPDYQSPNQRKLAAYWQRERRKPDKHGASGAGRQQGGSGAGRERG